VGSSSITEVSGNSSASSQPEEIGVLYCFESVISSTKQRGKKNQLLTKRVLLMIYVDLNWKIW